jgi:alpha-amylase
MNYMNVLSDFEIRVNRFIPDIQQQTEISKLNSLIHEKELIIDQQSAELSELKFLSGRKKKRSATSAKKEGLTNKKTTSKRKSARTSK